MRALLLAAGLGTRLRPLTETTPKCLVPIGGRPLLDYWLDLLLPGGIEQVLINTSYLAEQVERHVAQSRWRDRVTLVHEDRLLGTGGTTLANRSFLGHGPVLVAHADNLTDFDVGGLIRAHEARPRHCAMTMLAFHTDQPKLCGILALDEAGVVQEFHEKVENPPGNLANGAVYIFTQEILDFMATIGREFIDISTEVLPHFVGRILAVEHHGYHRDIGNVASWTQANHDIASGALRPA